MLTVRLTHLVVEIKGSIKQYTTENDTYVGVSYLEYFLGIIYCDYEFQMNTLPTGNILLTFITYDKKYVHKSIKYFEH